MSAAECAKAAVLAHKPPELDPDVTEFLAETAASLVEDAGGADAFREELEAAAAPHFEDLGSPADATSAFLDAVVEAAFGAAGGAPTTTGAPVTPGVAAGEERLIHVRDMLLMYGGSREPLLRNAHLELLRGHRYGVVGSNGSGKTTLMARIASKDIAGFPPLVRVVHLRHEAILHGVDLKMKARDYARQRNTGPTAASELELEQALRDVGFEGDDLLGKAVGELSGGWQMRLALACAVAQRATLLLLDEPTNHLDVAAVKWLADFVKSTCSGGSSGGTAFIISHDSDFLNDVCTDIVHFTDAKLNYHPGNFEDFKATVLQGDEERAKALLEAHQPSPDDVELPPWALPAADLGKLAFPAPEKIAGATPARPNPVVLTLTDACFRYAAESPLLLDKVSVQLTLGSRVAIVGKNGSGKSTLLSLLAGRLQASGNGAVPAHWSHNALRLVYIAQHHEKQLGEFLNCTPAEYIQLRFRKGYDAESALMGDGTSASSKGPSKKEVTRLKDVAKKHGKRGHGIASILSREGAGEDRRYEVTWQDLGPAENSFEKMARIKTLGCGYMIDEFDERMHLAWGEEGPRVLSQREVQRHLEDFGLHSEIACGRQVSMLSSGQRARLMLAASFWTRPHFVCLDEPTNYLDTDTVEALTKALRAFKGAYAIVSHNEKFVQEVCDEVWDVADGQVAIRGGEKSSRKTKKAA